MSQFPNDLDAVISCPRCASILERLPDDAWFCQKCVYGWTKDELAQNPNDLPQTSGTFTIKTGIKCLNLSEWKNKAALKAVLNGVSEVANNLSGSKPCQPWKAWTRFEVMGQLKGAPKPL
jgi:ribosomal protein L37AE/L43A